MMSNRVLRKFGEDFALRVGFRDDDGRKLSKSFQPPQYRPEIEDNEGDGIIQNMITKTLREGVSQCHSQEGGGEL